MIRCIADKQLTFLSKTNYTTYVLLSKNEILPS